MVRWNLAWLIIVLLFFAYFFMLDFKGSWGGLFGNFLKINDFSLSFLLNTFKKIKLFQSDLDCL